MSFQDPIVGGTVLLTDAIQSPNYSAGSAGWIINQDGSAEFNNVASRGSVIAKDTAGNTATFGSNIPNSLLGAQPGMAMQLARNIGGGPAIVGANDPGGISPAFQTLVTSPSPLANGAVAGRDYARISLSGAYGSSSTAIALTADNLLFNGAQIDANGNLSANNIQKGIVNITTVAGAWTEVSLTFPKAFASTPVVTVTSNNNAPTAGGTTQLEYAVTGITTTGCLIRVLRATAITMGIGWIAIA